jgi:hypothetical protein
MASDSKTEAHQSRRRDLVGPETSVPPARLDALSPWSVVVFVGLTALWFVFRTLPEPDARWFRTYSRLSGYAAAGLMLVPYVHILRRWFRQRYWGRLSTWLRWHLLSAYLGFGFALIHSRGRSNNDLTFAIQVLIWAVLISGVIGFYGQKLVYHLMGLLLDSELGLERLEPQRAAQVEQAEELAATVPVLTAEDVLDWQGLRDRLGGLADTWKNRLEPAAAAGQPQALPEKVNTPDPHQALKEALKSVTTALAPPEVPKALKAIAAPKKPDPEKEKADILSAVNRLVRAGGFSDVAELENLTPPEWLAPDFRKNSASRTATESVVVNHWLLTELMTGTVLAPAAARTRAVTGFFDRVLAESLRPALAPRGWFFSERARAPIPENHYLRIRELCATVQSEPLEELWELVESRRQMDLEAWLHRLGRIWLYVHGPASAALLVLVSAHIWLSVRYGGY